ILIGTHKILQDKLKFKALGLLIIDEEHRFGVNQKEAFKSMRAEIDILTLTATPIPRTLNMAMSGMRDLSIIATPPARRLSVKTFVRERHSALITEAITRELYRGGQVYFLHNAVDSIEREARLLAELIPTARIAVAHGQMHERELEQIMTDFYHRRHNVLVCTTIIETGIDVPTANTIIIDRADKFGLAQLHQLRGRVGRSHHQAYAFCLIPPKAKISSDATKRLEALVSMEELGSGFTLATQDLEIRGAGELLGDAQSGNIQSIGFQLYMELLEEAVASLKKGKDIDSGFSFKKGIEIDLQISALIPESYIPDVHTRLVLYKRIANAKRKEALEDLSVELMDRFGLFPEQTQNLFKIAELKLQAEALGICKIDAGPKGGRFEFGMTPQVDPGKIIYLIQKMPTVYSLEGPQKFRFKLELSNVKTRVEEVGKLMNALGTEQK
ncbi:MAG TPA: helicase-related protein, partial [Gammaproteobacteria bacterium]|nr:helicase-related protein [Gammaproteobacteria bacterium]